MRAGDDPVLNTGQVADLLGVHSKTVEKYLKAGRIAAAKREGRWFIRRSAVEAFLQPTNTAVA